MTPSCATGGQPMPQALQPLTPACRVTPPGPTACANAVGRPPPCRPALRCDPCLLDARPWMLTQHMAPRLLLLDADPIGGAATATGADWLHAGLRRQRQQPALGRECRHGRAIQPGRASHRARGAVHRQSLRGAGGGGVELHAGARPAVLPPVRRGCEQCTALDAPPIDPASICTPHAHAPGTGPRMRPVPQPGSVQLRRPAPQPCPRAAPAQAVDPRPTPAPPSAAGNAATCLGSTCTQEMCPRSVQRRPRTSAFGR